MEAEEDVQSVLTQETHELADILGYQDDAVLSKLYKMMDSRARERLVRAASHRERILEMLGYFSTADPAMCRQFLQMVCMHCDMPMRLESRLMSVTGSVTSDPWPTLARESLSLCDPEEVIENNSHTLVDESIASQGWCVKRPRIDHVESYKAAVRRFLLQRWERVMQGVVKEVRLEEAWVSLRHRTHVRPRDRADGALRPSELPQGDEEGTVEDRVTVHSLLGSEAQVTLLLGQAGSGKTLLMHCLGQKWTQDASPSFHLLILLEFRQLNLVARPLSLKELLFRFFLPPEGGEEECTAVLDFILENPEKICLIFDGYDEFHTKITHSGKLSSSFDPLCPLPMAELISGLCSRRILPGCTLLITCRPWDVTDLESSVDCIGELLGFNQRSVKEYAEQYFQDKGLNLKEKAVSHLLANHHLLTMCYLPALCHICCVCLDYIFSSGGSELLPQLPNTLTQVYLQILCAFLSRCPGSSTPLLQSHRAEVTLLGRLAMRGLEGSKIVFLSEEVPPDLVDFATKAGLLSQVDLTHEDGSKGQGYTFMHLTMQEFLGALHIMTSDDITEAQLRKKFNLKTRWTMKSNPKMVFTDSLHLYVCGLAAPACFSYLLQLVQGVGAVAWVKKRLALVRKLLRSLAMSTNLTGPKVVELCHCVQETQDAQLAREMVGSRPCFELRNITLNPVDLDALAFVVSSAGVGIGLDFGACSMELECLDILPSCQHIDFLIFRSRKYDDRFADKLSCILPRLPTLKRFEFICGNLTDVGAAKLARALESCPQITELNFSDNSLTDKGVREIADIFPKLPSLASVSLGKNGCSLESIYILLEKITSSPSIQGLYAEGMKDVSVLFVPSVDMKCSKDKTGLTVSLLNCRFTTDQMNRLCQLLARCPGLSVLDLSGGDIKADTLKALTDSLQELNISKQIVLNEIPISVDGLMVLTSFLSVCPDVVQVDISLQDPVRVSILFAGGIEKQHPEMSKKLRLIGCALLPPHLDHLCENLTDCSALTLLDISNNSLGNKGLKKLLDLLPQLSNIQEINVSENAVSMEGVVLLADTLCSHRNMSEVNVSHGGKKLFLKFHSSKRIQSEALRTSPDMEQDKKLSLTHSDIQPTDMTRLCRRLVQCPGLLKLDFSHGSLKDDAIENLLNILPKMTSLQLLNMSHVQMSTDGVLLLVRSLIDCQRVRAVELRPQGEAFIKFVNVKAEQATCRLTQYTLSSGDMEKLSGILEQCPHLSDLDLSSNLLRDEGVKSFVDSLPRLRIASSVNLNDNRLTQMGALYLVNTVMTFEKVAAIEVSLGTEERSLIRFEQDSDCGKTLSLRECHFGADHLQRLAEILTRCAAQLVKLRIRNNGLSVQVIEDLVKQLRCGHIQRYISIEEPWITAEAAVNLLSCCLNLNPNIHTIGVNNSTVHITLEECQNPTATSGGTSTDMSGSLSTVAISLVDCAVQGHHLVSLQTVFQRCVLLQELDLETKETSEDVVLLLAEGLLQAKSIESLNLSGHMITDREAVALTRALQNLPHLRTINLSLCYGWTPAGALELVRGLGQCLSLEGISLDSVQLDEESTVCLAEGLHAMTSLKRLNLNNKVTMVTGSPWVGATLVLLASLEGLRGMEELELEGMRISDNGVEELIKHLPTWTGLRKISLSGNCISDQAGERLVQALTTCTALEELNLSRNNLSLASAAKMGQVLPTLTHFRVLDLSENEIGTKGSVSISKALISMKYLTKIHLTSIGTSELAGLADSLAHCVCAEDVSFAWNDCGDDVAVKLAEVLPQCQKLRRLDLESNSISTIGAEALARSLQSCPSVEVIRLWRNFISTSDAQKLRQKEKRLNFSST
ncbi:NLR family, CARD domain containing 5 isoform X2 [Oncorhynchus tshawytscha]|uniref:NLR family, CARD domain containing 5 isoform X2 n=1 Tax=Oncorhynchus tshawytscha TaxID=74940 RepID=UPI000D0A575B|nr:NLR family, CARD domain containing 5 isoform X2 [Oncorhynchus tshawytscha]